MSTNTKLNVNAIPNHSIGMEKLIVDAMPVMTETTWAALKEMRDDSLLSPGHQYRITDYVTKTKKDNVAIAASGYTSAHHAFDLVVTADDVNVLNENVRAMLHDGDTYFASQNLEAWQVQYCIDNDTDRFDWVDNTCMGAIYHMVDETGHDFPYDVKNIMFVRKITNGQLDETSGTLTWVYSLNIWSGSTCLDGSLLLPGYGFSPCCLKEYVKTENQASLAKRILNNGVCLSKHAIKSGGWTCGYNCYNWTCGSACHGWNCGNYCYGWTCGAECNAWSCGNYCDSWRCGNTCNTWTCGDNCSYWQVLDSCYEWRAESNSSGWKINKSYCKHFIIDIAYVLGSSCTITHSGTTTSSSYLQNFYIGHYITSGTIDLECPLGNTNGTLHVERNSSGTIKQFYLVS